MTAHRHGQDNLSVEGIKAMKFNNNDASGTLKMKNNHLLQYILMYLNGNETNMYGK